MVKTEIEGSPGNLEPIMEEIRRRIEEKKRTGQYSPEDLKEIEGMGLKIKAQTSDGQEGDLQYHLSQVNYLCDTARPPELSSHRKVVGNLVTGIKKLIRKITDPYIQMVLKRQVEFNVEIVRLLNQMALDFRYRWSDQEKKQDLLEAQWKKMEQTLESIPQELKTQKNIFEAVLAKLEETGPSTLPSERTLEDLKSRVRASEYVRFEDRHRGSQEDIKWKQRNYLTYFKNGGSVLDIGCGRGEFLELLREASIPARGIDINQEMVDHCRAKGLEVSREEGLNFLQGLADENLGGIFLSQVIEHLDQESLRELVRVSFAKLKAGGVLLAETINPQCLSTFSGAFYLDLSHNNPIHPEAARFLWESFGFRKVEILYVSPFPEDMKLQEMARREDDTYEDELARVLNENIRRLNTLLYGFQDYAVLGYK
jgi:2-polyprenyl-3-methyl-5-hydroxy-6-metoxy-1,4-benzoquinol methylase